MAGAFSWDESKLWVGSGRGKMVEYDIRMQYPLGVWRDEGALTTSAIAMGPGECYLATG